MPGTEKESDKSSSGSLTWIQWVQLLVVSSGVFLSALDVSVNVALPRISEYFYSSPSTTYLMIIFYLGIFYGVYLPSVYKVYAQDYLSDYTLTLAGSLGMFSNGFFKILMASL